MASSSYEDPCSVPILTCESNGKVRLHEDALQKIFRRPEVQDKPVCIVSISGAFRKGKSFMLNFFIRYLRNKGHVDESWMGDADVPMMDGFDWRGGRQACTNGILMWSEVFTVERDDGEVAVILMDTQGLFDNKTNNKTNSIIFALSTLISSVQIFNLTQQIQESDLGFLQFFTAYAEAARKASLDKTSKPFQSLVFLVRDWPHAVELPYGTTGGAGYLDEVLSEKSTSEELTAVRKYLRSSFEDTRCCLMPHPGHKVATTSYTFRGCLRDIDDEFLRQTASFVDSLFRPSKLVVKTISGQVVSAPAILQYISDCGASLTDGKLPNPKTMMENVAEAQNFEAQRRCSEKYTQNMKEILGDSFVEDDFLREMHDQASSTVLVEFAELSRFGGDESRKKHRDYLETTITREHDMLVQVNRSKRAEAESDMLHLIDGIIDKYEEEMKEATDEQEFVSESELDEIHGRCANEAYESYATDENTNPKLKDKYFEKLQERLERIYERIKSENDEKIRIAEEQNERIRQTMKMELQCAIQYREKMRTIVDRYVEEDELARLGESCRRTALDQFQIRALENNVSPDSDTFTQHLASLKTKLDEEYEEIVQVNRDKRDTLDKDLESQRQKAIVEYERVFKSLLKDTYMEKADLRQKHEEVVGKIMSSLRSGVQSNIHLPIVQRYLEGTEEELEAKYGMVEKWNEKNNTFLRKCFKVLKTVVAPVVTAFALLKKLF